LVLLSFAGWTYFLEYKTFSFAADEAQRTLDQASEAQKPGQHGLDRLLQSLQNAH
jgi:hypothetical protein